MRTQTLTNLIASAKSRADLIRSGFVTTAEWTEFVNAGIVELAHEIKSAYGEEYQMAYYPFSTTSGTDEYDLPLPMWGNKGVEVQIGGLWYPVPRFGMAARLQYQTAPSVMAAARLNNLKYALWGYKLKLIPNPDGAYPMRVLYDPVPDRLATLSYAASAVNLSTNTISIPSHGLRPDQLVRPGVGTGTGAALSSGLRADTDYWAIVPSKDTLQLAATPAGGGTATPVALGSAGTGTNVLDGVLDGVAGWEEWPILSAAIKALAKGEDDTLALEKQLYGIPGDPNQVGIKGMIRAAINQRDSSEPLRIVNVHQQYAYDTLIHGDY